MSVSLRLYQQEAIVKARDAVREGKRSILIVSPTGSGKTTIGAELVRLGVARGAKCVWVAHRRELISQAAERIESFGVPVGRDGAGADRPCQVISVQTALARGKTPDGTMVFFDEAHHYAGTEEWCALPKLYKDSGALLIGFSATPERADGAGLGETFDSLIVAAQIGDLIEAGHLTGADIFEPASAVRNGYVMRLPVDAYLEQAPGESCIVFAPHVKAAYDFASQFVAKGVRALVVHGKTPKEERDFILSEFSSGEVPVVCNVNVLTEGYDAPRAKCAIIARKIGSTSLYLQMVGRVLRPWEGKRAKILDLTGVVQLHGPPEEERVYSLEGRAVTRKGAAEDSFCRVCGAIKVPGEACEACGDAGKPLETPDAQGGALVKFAAMRAMSNDKRVVTLGRWYAIAESKGHKLRSADHKYKAVFGHWPTTEIQAQARRMTG